MKKMVLDLEITIELKSTEDEDEDFRRILAIHDLFEKLINELRDLRMYNIEMRGHHKHEWIKNPHWAFKK